MNRTDLSRISYGALIRFHMAFAAMVGVACLLAVVICGNNPGVTPVS
jgi:hypothetical protein